MLLYRFVLFSLVSSLIIIWIKYFINFSAGGFFKYRFIFSLAVFSCPLADAIYPATRNIMDGNPTLPYFLLNIELLQVIKPYACKPAPPETRSTIYTYFIFPYRIIPNTGIPLLISVNILNRCVSEYAYVSRKPFSSVKFFS